MQVGCVRNYLGVAAIAAFEARRAALAKALVVQEAAALDVDAAYLVSAWHSTHCQAYEWWPSCCDVDGLFVREVWQQHAPARPPPSHPPHI